ncbi:MAG: hypothetical protein ABJB66_12930 [Gemmatimonadaceae bacterium]
MLGAVGATLPAGFGIAVAGRTFQEFNTEHTQHSQYFLLLGQYAAPTFPRITFNLGAGHAKHNGDHADSDSNFGSGPVISGGATVRLPAGRRAALTLSANLLKDVGGSSNFRPTTKTLGIGFNFGTSCRNSRC